MPKVLYRGSVHPKVLFVGEAPGPSEKVIGKPFVGPSGKLLDLLISESGITSYGMTNVIACYPTEDDTTGVFRKPSKVEIVKCSERLSDLVECVRPCWVISVGKVAKANPPSGVTYAEHIDHPSFILRKGGRDSIYYKRNRHRLIKFAKEKGIYNG